VVIASIISDVCKLQFKQAVGLASKLKLFDLWPYYLDLWPFDL